MTDTPIINRIRGVRIAPEALPPSFFIDDPARVCFVEHGYLDIFAVEMIDGDAVGRRQFVTRIPADAIAFGSLPTPDPAQPGRAFSFLAAPSIDAVIIAGERGGIATEAFDLDAVSWVDEWISQLSEFLVKRWALPPDAWLLEADQGVPYPADAVVSAQHADIIWVRTNKPTRLLGRSDLVVDAQAPLLPLSERTWLKLGVKTDVSAFLTPTALLDEQFWSAFDCFSARVLAFASLSWVEMVKASEERHETAHQARRTAVAGALGNLSGVLGKEIGGELASAVGRTPVQKATSLVAASCGVTLDIPHGFKEADDPMDTASALARISGIRTRRVALTSGWWRRDGPSVIGFTADKNKPLGLLTQSRGAYRAIDPEAGAAVTVGSGEADAIASHGLVLYAPLPDDLKDRKTVLRFALHGQGRDLYSVLFMLIVGGFFSLLTPILMGQLLAEIIPRVDVPMWTAALGALLIGALVGSAFQIGIGVALLRIEGRMDERFQAAIWSRLVSLPAPFFRKFTAGDLASRTNGISQIRQLLAGATIGAVVGSVLALFSLGLLFYYSWLLALCAVGLVAILAGVALFFALGQLRHHRAALNIQGTIDGMVFQMINGLAKLRVANAESYAFARWAKQYSEQTKEGLAADRWSAAQSAFMSFFQPLTTLVVFAVVYYAFIRAGQQQSFGLASFLSFNAAFGQLMGAVISLMGAVTVVVAAIPYLERIRPILNARPEALTGAVDPGDIVGSIEFTNVTFRYLPEGPNAVEGVSFRIRPGDYVAFVGPSGSGKSTIYRLLLGFEQPGSGAVLLDGHDLSSLDMPAVRARMGTVLQNGELVPGSILENIVGSSRLTMEEAWAAARAAGVEEDIRAMSMGMHTVLAEGGSGLSGGQKQRLLIACALSRKPRVLLFDEATSALDNSTQVIVQESLEKLSVTRIVIAHRLSTIRNVDRIFVMEAGRIVETGRYEELMKRGGSFAALSRRQLV